MGLRYEDISYAYGDHPVLEQVNLEAGTGDITCLLGPSGGGKSTLLRLAAGLEPLQKGRILLDGEVLASPGAEPAPEARPIGLMFQENALFPHLTVAQNVAFGLDRMPRNARNTLVKSLLQSVGLADYGSRYPHTLSGGQQQRIALARSLAPEPRVLLMDEPYASIDNTRRRMLREAARQTLKQTGTTTVLVTHDPAEALEMADVIAVLDGGRIVQTGSPRELYETPGDPTVAGLFGDSQVLDARRSSTGFSTDYGDIAAVPSLRAGSENCRLVVRPTGLLLDTGNGSRLRITDMRYIGGGWLVFLMLENAHLSLVPLRVAVDSLAGLQIGDAVGVRANEQDFFVFDR